VVVHDVDILADLMRIL